MNFDLTSYLKYITKQIPHNGDLGAARLTLKEKKIIREKIYIFFYFLSAYAKSPHLLN